MIIGSGFGLKLIEAFHHTKTLLILIEKPFRTQRELSVRNLAKRPCRGREGCRGCSIMVYHGCLHTTVVASGLAASSPLTWHVVLRFTGAGRDDIEDLGRTSIWSAVWSFCHAACQLGPCRAGDILCFILVISFSLHCSGVLAFQRWKQEKKACLLHAPLCMPDRCLLWPQATLTQAVRKTGKLQNKMQQDTKMSCVTVLYVRLLTGFWFKSERRWNSILILYPSNYYLHIKIQLVCLIIIFFWVQN